MKRLWIIAATLLLTTNVSACSPNDPPITPETEKPDKKNNNDEKNNNQGENEDMTLTIKVGSTTFTATLTDNEAAKAFKGMLPMTISMSELNNNEKYYYLPNSLPIASFTPGTINSGDLMLYGTDCLVLFYKTFSTSYRYTKIGRIDNASGLENALGTGKVTVTFEK